MTDMQWVGYVIVRITGLCPFVFGFLTNGGLLLTNKILITGFDDTPPQLDTECCSLFVHGFVINFVWFVSILKLKLI